MSTYLNLFNQSLRGKNQSIVLNRVFYPKIYIGYIIVPYGNAW